MNYKMLVFVFAMLFTVSLHAQDPEVTLELQESANGCGLSSDCDNGFVCFDIVMTIDLAKDLDAYNIFVMYDQTVVSRVNGGDDASCVIDDGGDTDLESVGAYRVGGVPGSPFPIAANTPTIVHTICFQVVDFGTVGYTNYDTTTISVGGSLFSGALQTTVGFNDGTEDNDIPEDSLVVGPSTAPCLPVVLPVQFIDLNAYTVNNNHINVDWATATEINNEGFEIQRSSDGMTFNTIDWVEGKGTAVGRHNYRYEDHEAVKGLVYYYRIKQLDYDGQYSMTDIVTASLKRDQILSLKVSPNPYKVGEKLLVSINSKNHKGASIKVYDLVGRLVINQGVELKKGDNNFLLESGPLTSGEYIVVVKNSSQHLSRKVIVLD